MALSPQTIEQAAWYLAGIIDGEGHISTNPKNKLVVISNTDPAIIAATQHALDLLGVQYTTRDAWVREGNKKAFRINIGRHSEIIKLAVAVSLQSAQKYSALQAIADTPLNSWSDDDQRIEEIRLMYWRDGQSVRSIAAALGTSKGRIEKVMDRYQIPRRDRITAVKEALTYRT